jgi:hypothetical protein
MSRVGNRDWIGGGNTVELELELINDQCVSGIKIVYHTTQWKKLLYHTTRCGCSVINCNSFDAICNRSIYDSKLRRNSRICRVFLLLNFLEC